MPCALWILIASKRAELTNISTGETMINKVCSVFLLTISFFVLFFSPEITLSSDNVYKVGLQDRIFAVHFLDRRNGWVVGDGGVILSSKDGGKTWKQLITAWENSFNDVTFVGKRGWIVGDRGIILHTEDGGDVWERQESHCQASLMAVDFIDGKRGVAIGQQMVLWTEDGGLRWQPSPLDWEAILPEALIERGVISPNLYDLFFLDETRGWMVGDNGMVFISYNLGKHWELLSIGMYPPLYSVFFKNKQEGFAAGQGGTLLHTKDGGKTWRNLSLPTEKNLFKIKLTGDYGVAAGDLGTILQTSNGGKTWKLLPLALRPPPPWFLDVSLIMSDTSVKAICVGEGIIREISIPASSSLAN